MGRPFLSAEWRNLVMANYAVEPAILLPYLPAHTSLDEFNGKVFVSLVGFLFANTRVLGMRIPFHVNFEEVNLRFYVTHKDGAELKRGVVFIKEIVPKAAISIVANTLYREKYCTMPMSHGFKLDDQLSVDYRWKHKGKWNAISAIAEMDAIPIPPESQEEFIAEHYYGYSRFNAQKTFEYRVAHPRWDIHPVSAYKIDCDFGGLYGPAFAGLKDAVPASVFLAKGSTITVSDKREL